MRVKLDGSNCIVITEGHGENERRITVTNVEATIDALRAAKAYQAMNSDDRVSADPPFVFDVGV